MLRSIALALAVLALAAGLSACDDTPPGTADLGRAGALMSAPGGVYEDLRRVYSPDTLAQIRHHLDAAVAAGHPRAAVIRAHLVQSEDGPLAAAPLWRDIARDHEWAWVLTAMAASAERAGDSRIGAGLIEAGMSADTWVLGSDLQAEIAVLREGVAAGSTTADSVLQTRLRQLDTDARALGDSIHSTSPAPLTTSSI